MQNQNYNEILLSSQETKRDSNYFKDLINSISIQKP